VPEYGFLELQVRMVKLAIDVDGRNLRRHVRVERLQPENIRLVALHEGQQLVEPDGRLALARDARFDDVVLCHGDAFHFW